MHVAIRWAASTLGVTGALLVAFQKPVAGFAVWISSNVLWIIWAMGQRDVPTGTMFVVYLAITVLGLLRWHGSGPAVRAETETGGGNDRERSEVTT